MRYIIKVSPVLLLQIFIIKVCLLTAQLVEGRRSEIRLAVNKQLITRTTISRRACLSGISGSRRYTISRDLKVLSGSPSDKQAVRDCDDFVSVRFFAIIC